MAASQQVLNSDACGISADGLHARPRWLHPTIERKRNAYTGEVWFEYDGSRFLTPTLAQTYFDTLNATMAQGDARSLGESGQQRPRHHYTQTAPTSTYPSAPLSQMGYAASETAGAQRTAKQAPASSSTPPQTKRVGVRPGGGAHVFSPDSIAASPSSLAPVSPTRLPMPVGGGSTLAALAASRSAQAALQQATDIMRAPSGSGFSSTASVPVQWPAAPSGVPSSTATAQGQQQQEGGPRRVDVVASPLPVASSPHALPRAAAHLNAGGGRLGELLAGGSSDDEAPPAPRIPSQPPPAALSQLAESGASDDASCGRFLSSPSGSLSADSMEHSPPPQPLAETHDGDSAGGKQSTSGGGSSHSSEHASSSSDSSPDQLQSLREELLALRGVMAQQQSMLEKMTFARHTAAQGSVPARKYGAQGGQEDDKGGLWGVHAAADACNEDHTLCFAPHIVGDATKLGEPALDFRGAALMQQIRESLGGLGGGAKELPSQGGGDHADNGRVKKRRKKKVRSAGGRRKRGSGGGGRGARLPSVVISSTACQPSVAASGRSAATAKPRPVVRRTVPKAKAVKKAAS